MTRSVPDEQWLALTALTETARSSEWLPVMFIILNRLRSGKYPPDLFRVVSQRFQFSAFNRYQAITDEAKMFSTMRDDLKFPPNLWRDALSCARAVLSLPPACNPLPPAVLLYWSPRSMSPAGSLPQWDWNLLFCFALPGIPEERFIFAQEVAADSGLGGKKQRSDSLPWPPVKG